MTVSGWLDGLTEARDQFERVPKKGYLDLNEDPVPEVEAMEDNETDDHDLKDDDPKAFFPERRVRQKTSDVPFTDIPLPAGNDGAAPLPPAGPPEDEMADYVPDSVLEEPPAEPSANPWQPLRGENDESGNESPPKRPRQALLELYYAKLETLFKARQRKEIKLRELNDQDTQAFFNATSKEINNNLDTGAYKILDESASEKIRATTPERIMASRYVRTAKPLEQDDIDKAKMEGTLLHGDHGGPCKAKVRHVMKGFSEEGAEELEAATPQVTREAVMFTAQLIASKQWDLGFLDLTQAFHSGDNIQRELYAEQPSEGIRG